METGLHELFKTRCKYVPVRLPSAIPADDSLEKLMQTCRRHHSANSVFSVAYKKLRKYEIQ